VNIAQNLLTAFIKFQEFPQIVQNLKEKREIFNKYSRNTSLLDDTRVSKESLEYSAAEKEFLDAYNKFNTSLTDSIASVQQAIESLRSQGKLEEVEAIQDLLAKAMHYGLNYVEPQFKELVSNFQANGAIWKDRLSYLINLGNVANKGVGTIDEHAIKEYILQLDVTDALHFVVPFILPSAQLINIKDKSVASVTEALGEFANLGVLSHAPVQGTVGIVKALTSTISTPFYFLNDVAQNYIYQELHSLSQILRDASKQYNGQKRVNLNRILAKIKDADKVFKLGEYHSLEFKNCELKASNKWKGKVSILTSTVENFVFENAKIEALDMRNCSISNLKIVDSELINCDFADFDSSAFNYLEIRNSVEIHNSKFDMHSFAGLIDKVYGTPNEIKIDVSNISIANLTTSDKTKLRQILSVVPNIEAFIERNPSFKDLFKPELIAEDIATNVDKNNPKHRFLENALFDIISCYTKDEQLYFINPKLFGLICKRIEAPLTEAKQYSQKTLEQDLKERVSEVLVDIIQNKDQYLEDQSLKSELSIFDIIAPKTFLPAFNMFATKTQNLLDVLANAKKMYERSGKKEKVHLADLIFVDSSSSGFKADRYTVLNFTGCEFSQLHGGGDLDLDFIIVSGLQFKNSKMSNVNLSNSTIQYLKMIDSELSEFDFDSVSIRNIEIKNSTLDKQTFFGIMAAMQNHGMSAVSLQDITPSNDFIEYLKEPQNANELRNTLAHLRNFDAFLNDNPIFKEHLNNVYNKNDLLNEITQEINAFECDAILLDDRKTLLIAALKKVIETLNMEEIREFYRVQDKIMGAKAYAYGMVKGSGIINIMTSVHYIDRLWYGDYLNEFLIEDAVERIIEENVKCVQYSVERKKIAQNIISMIESHREELACVDFNALTKAITGAVEVVGDQYISLLNRAQDKVVGSLQYSYFSGYYHTGLLSIAHESSYMQHDHMLDKVKKIMAQEMGSNFIFDSDREIAEVTKS
ncbi:MAG: hypothetical protein ACK5WS_00690, partial [Alphaproteobacteria bacterium]